MIWGDDRGLKPLRSPPDRNVSAVYLEGSEEAEQVDTGTGQSGAHIQHGLFGAQHRVTGVHFVHDRRPACIYFGGAGAQIPGIGQGRHRESLPRQSIRRPQWSISADNRIAGVVPSPLPRPVGEHAVP